MGFVCSSVKGWPYQLKVNKLFSYGPGNIREDAKCVYTVQ